MTIRRLLLALPLLLLAAQAQAADIRVLTAGAYRPVLDGFALGFEQRTGNTIHIVTDTAGGVAARVQRGEPFDIAILSLAAADELQRSGKLLLVTPIATVGMGVAVRQGAPKPDLSTTAALKAALLAAPKVAMVDPALGGTSSAHFLDIFKKLGIADAMKPKLVLTPAGQPADRVATGAATLALTQISEIVSVKGAALAGPLPPELQVTTVYVAGMHPKAAEAPFILLAALAGPEAKALLKENGMNPP